MCIYVYIKIYVNMPINIYVHIIYKIKVKSFTNLFTKRRQLLIAHKTKTKKIKNKK